MNFVEVLKQRNTREENKQVKKEEVPEEWKANSHKLRQKDIDARWTKKNNQNYYGYKNHIKTDSKSKLIKKYAVTDASAHDSQPLEQLIDQSDTGKSLHADSAYTEEQVEGVLKKSKVKYANK